VPGSISSASDLQTGHVAIAIPHCGAANNYTPLQPKRLSLVGQRHSIINTCLPKRSQASVGRSMRDRRVMTPGERVEKHFGAQARKILAGRYRKRDFARPSKANPRG
jgi:hypothetical protein